MHLSSVGSLPLAKNALHSPTSNTYCLAPVVASEALNLRDTIIFIRSVQPWTPEPKKGDDTELEQSEYMYVGHWKDLGEGVCVLQIEGQHA